MSDTNTTNNRTELALSKKQIIVLSLFYLLCFLIGGFLFVTSIVTPNIYNESGNIIIKSGIGSIGSALLGSSIYYVRKLYKALINGNLKTNQKENLRIGTFLYFFARPIMSTGLSLIIILGMLCSSFIMFTADVELSIGFQYLAMFISFFGGFSIGNFLPRLESKGKYLANKMLK